MERVLKDARASGSLNLSNRSLRFSLSICEFLNPTSLQFFFLFFFFWGVFIDEIPSSNYFSCVELLHFRRKKYKKILIMVET